MLYGLTALERKPYYLVFLIRWSLLILMLAKDICICIRTDHDSGGVFLTVPEK